MPKVRCKPVDWLSVSFAAAWAAVALGAASMHPNVWGWLFVMVCVAAAVVELILAFRVTH